MHEKSKHQNQSLNNDQVNASVIFFIVLVLSREFQNIAIRVNCELATNITGEKNKICQFYIRSSYCNETKCVKTTDLYYECSKHKGFGTSNHSNRSAFLCYKIIDIMIKYYIEVYLFHDIKKLTESEIKTNNFDSDSSDTANEVNLTY